MEGIGQSMVRHDTSITCGSPRRAGSHLSPSSLLSHLHLSAVIYHFKHLGVAIGPSYTTHVAQSHVHIVRSAIPDAPCRHSKLAHLSPAEPSQGAQESSDQRSPQCNRSTFNRQQGSATPTLLDEILAAHLRFCGTWSGSCSDILRLSAASSPHHCTVYAFGSGPKPHE
jgi:hypothetical protein